MERLSTRIGVLRLKYFKLLESVFDIGLNFFHQQRNIISVARGQYHFLSLPGGIRTRHMESMAPMASNNRLPCPLDASSLIMRLNPVSPTEIFSPEKLKFGSQFTPHMLEIDWSLSLGWSSPYIRPFSNISLHPASSSLHYGLEVFEGLKAFRFPDSTVAIFRPDKNIARLYHSCERMCLPTFDQNELLKLLCKLVEIESPFVPYKEGYSLYLRPLVISTQATLGVGPPEGAKLLIICSPVGPYFMEGYKAIKIVADSRYVRAWPGGTGDAKCGGYVASHLSLFA